MFMNYNENSLINHHFSNLLAKCAQWKAPHTIVASLYLADESSSLSLYSIASSLAKGFSTCDIALDSLIIHLVEVDLGAIKDVFFLAYLKYLLSLTSIHPLDESYPH